MKCSSTVFFFSSKATK